MCPWRGRRAVWPHRSGLSKQAGGVTRSAATKARAIKYQPGGGVRLVETTAPDPGPGEVQVRAAACGICAWDLYTDRHGSDPRTRRRQGTKASAECSIVGAGVSGLAESAPVVAFGFATVHNLQPARRACVADPIVALECWIVEPVSRVVTGMDHTRSSVGEVWR